MAIHISLSNKKAFINKKHIIKLLIEIPGFYFSESKARVFFKGVYLKGVLSTYLVFYIYLIYLLWLRLYINDYNMFIIQNLLYFDKMEETYFDLDGEEEDWLFISDTEDIYIF